MCIIVHLHVHSQVLQLQYQKTSNMLHVHMYKYMYLFPQQKIDSVHASTGNSIVERSVAPSVIKLYYKLYIIYMYTLNGVVIKAGTQAVKVSCTCIHVCYMYMYTVRTCTVCTCK